MEVSQDSKDLFILNLIKDFFQTGKVYSETRGITKYRLTQKNEILSILIPYFENNPLLGRFVPCVYVRVAPVWGY